MTERELMLAEELYVASDEELVELRIKKFRFLDEFHATKYEDFEERERLARGIFAHVGKNAVINKPFHCDYGCHISVGDNFFANFGCVLLDVNKIEIGDNVFLAPNVCMYTAGHPIDKDVRNEQLEYGKAITIGNDVWIGGSTVINPGVTIGSNVVIGSGSVVTRDIPDCVVAYGNPCRVRRKITEEDKIFWQKEKERYLRLKKTEKEAKK